MLTVVDLNDLRNLKSWDMKLDGPSPSLVDGPKCVVPPAMVSMIFPEEDKTESSQSSSDSEEEFSEVNFFF